MPFYDFRCIDCGDFEEFAKMEDRDSVLCPECGSLSETLLSSSSVKGDPTTLGALADKNTKKMGKYELENRRLKDGSVQREKKKAEYDRIRKLAKMTPKQKDDYIHEGKTPPGF